MIPVADPRAPIEERIETPRLRERRLFRGLHAHETAPIGAREFSLGNVFELIPAHLLNQRITRHLRAELACFGRQERRTQAALKVHNIGPWVGGRHVLDIRENRSERRIARPRLRGIQAELAPFQIEGGPIERALFLQIGPVQVFIRLPLESGLPAALLCLKPIEVALVKGVITRRRLLASLCAFLTGLPHPLAQRTRNQRDRRPEESEDQYRQRQRHVAMKWHGSPTAVTRRTPYSVRKSTCQCQSPTCR